MDGEPPAAFSVSMMPEKVAVAAKRASVRTSAREPWRAATALIAVDWPLPNRISRGGRSAA